MTVVWRSILVHLDDDPRCDARVDLAARVARDRDARLVGIAPTGWVDWMYPVLPTRIGSEQLALAFDALRRQAGAHAQHFREHCGGFCIDVKADVEEGDAASAIVQRGHGSDLIVLGQADPSRPDRRHAQALVEQVVLHASRPTLLVPYAGTFDTVGSSIVLAWDGGREGARAAADAMPMLCTAREVRLVHFAEPEDDGAMQADASLRAAADWLLWHGVQATVHPQASKIDVGDALLSLASDVDADLIVMGAYGHSRWSERVLGGATRSLLRQMTVPVLMSR
jgi:nucleotide-binding universal stress UspA family protein